MRSKRKSHTETASGINARISDRDDCAHYMECLTKAAKSMEKCLHCPRCDRFEEAAVKKDYAPRYFEGSPVRHHNRSRDGS